MPYVPYTNNARTIATALHHQALKRYKNPKAIPSFLLADSWNNHFECVRVPRNIALFGILQVIASRVVCGDPFNAALYHGEGVMRDIRSPKEVMAGVVDTDGDRVLHVSPNDEVAKRPRRRRVCRVASCRVTSYSFHGDVVLFHRGA